MDAQFPPDGTVEAKTLRVRNNRILSRKEDSKPKMFGETLMTSDSTPLSTAAECRT
jgi:hypothetical protein